MKSTINGDKKWLKLGAAAFLSVTMLAACGDNEDDTDVDVIDPPGDVDDGTNTDVDVDMDDDANKDDGVDMEDDTNKDDDGSN